MTLKIFLLFALIMNSPLSSHARNASSSVNFAVGSRWDRKAPSAEDMENLYLKKLILSSAKIFGRKGARGKDVGVGTGIYLGKHNNQHILITNHHVVPDDNACEKIGVIKFPYLGKTNCRKVILTIPEIDMSIVSVRIINDEKFRTLQPLLFDANNSYKAGTSLMTAGFGVYQNDIEQITVDTSSNCQLMRANQNLIGLQINSSKEKIPSLIHSCELSVGDSGSAIVESVSGKILGLNYFVSTVRNPKVNDDRYIEIWKTTQSPEMLNSLSYAIPSAIIKESLEDSLEQDLDYDDKLVIESLLIKSF